MTTQSKRMPFAIAGIVGCCAIILLAALVAGGAYFFVAGGQFPTIGQPAIGGEIKDPIVTMLVAASMDAKGRLVDAKFTFDTTQPQMTVIVQAGKVTNAPLDLVWYQVTDAGDQKLFEHHVQVDAYERAYSVGKNPGTLAEGTYKAVATLGGQTKTIEFDVEQTAAQPATGAAPVSTPQGQPPVDGGSGKRAAPAPPFAPPPTAAGCTADITPDTYAEGAGGALMYKWADTLKVFVTVDCADAQVLQLYGAANGVERLLGQMELGRGDAEINMFPFNPCSVRPGRDLPGTKVAFRLAQIGPDGSATNIAHLTVTLGEDDSKPKLHVDSTPAKGTKVKAGDKISLKIKAWEERSGETWQTGVMDIQVTADPGGLHDSKDYSQYKGKSCDAKSWEPEWNPKPYTVPNNPPPVIKLCVIAKDFAGNKKTHCAEFLTGNTWKGKLHAVSTEVGACNNETWDGEFRVVVGGNGDVQGKGSAHLVAPPQCVGYNTTCLPHQATQEEFDVLGAFDRGQFQLVFRETYRDSPGKTCGLSNYTIWLDASSKPWNRSPSNFTVPVIAPGDAEAQLSNSVTFPSGTANGQFTFTLLCEDCK